MCPDLRSLDLSSNLLTDAEDGKDIRGVKDILKALKGNSSLTHIILTGCEIPSEMAEQMQCSVQVNRSLVGVATGNHFETYIENLAWSRAPPPRVDPYLTFVPSLTVDPAFVAKSDPTAWSKVTVLGDAIYLSEAGTRRHDGKRFSVLAKLS